MSLRRDEDGVAVVVGAILVTALLVAMFVNVRLTYVPAWEKENEVDHMEATAGRLLDLKKALEGPQDNKTAAGHAVPLPLRPSKALLAAAPPPTHRVDISPDGKPFRVFAETFLPAAVGRPGRDAFVEDWANIQGTIDDVDDVQNFRLRLDSAGGDGGYGHVRIVMRDASGNWAGNFTFIQSSGGDELIVEVTDPKNDELYSNPVASGLDSPVRPYWVDVLDPEYRFGGLLERAVKPVSMEFQRIRLVGQYTVSYTTSAGTGVSTSAGSTTEPVELNRTFVGGPLIYHGDTSRMVRQTLTMENGALVLEQDDGAVFRAPPTFDARHHNGLLFVTLAVPSVTGEPASASGAPEAILQVTTLDFGGMRGLTPEFTLNVTTAWPALWADHWSRTLDSVPAVADVEDAYEVATGDDWASLTVNGLGDDEDDHDLFLTLHQRTVRVSLGGP